MHIKLYLSFSLLLTIYFAPYFAPCAFSQTVKVINQETSASFRGLSVVSDSVVWVSGSNGTVGRSINGGKDWQWIPVPGFQQCDFRDIEAFDAEHAIIMAVASPAYILKTENGGKSWKVVYENRDTAMFLDDMDFYDEKNGVAIGDPIDGKFFILKTTDGGNTWKEDNSRIFAEEGEACFASSGTNIKMLTNNQYAFITGGLSSRIITPLGIFSTGLSQHINTSGANSFDRIDNKIIIVGGDFTNSNSREKTCVVSFDSGFTWHSSSTNPYGYRSGVIHYVGNTWFTCGLNGVDVSFDDGLNWKSISKEGFHVIKKSKSGRLIFLAGGIGRIGKLEF